MTLLQGEGGRDREAKRGGPKGVDRRPAEGARAGWGLWGWIDEWMGLGRDLGSEGSGHSVPTPWPLPVRAGRGGGGGQGWA